jgi:hypothetical protein
VVHKKCREENLHGFLFCGGDSVSSVSGAVGAYYAVKNMNASISAHAALQKISQDAMTQQMKELLKTLPAGNPAVGRFIDVRA